MESSVDLDATSHLPARGLFDARYLAFLETVQDLRPKLHRYCARMTGSSIDGEDVVQDALFLAYRKLDSFDGIRPFGPWIFRIAHNQCIDFLRRRDVRRSADVEGVLPQAVHPVETAGVGVGRAIEHLVLSLPPKERACVLLKDVFDYSLEEVADLVGSTVGGVKAALSRGRSKLEATRNPRLGQSHRNPETKRLLDLYVEHFNRRDWDSLRDLIAADAHIDVADRYSGPVSGAPYFAQYSRQTTPWRTLAGAMDGHPVIIVSRQAPGSEDWVPTSVVHLGLSGDRIIRIADYAHCPWVMLSATAIVIDQ